MIKHPYCPVDVLGLAEGSCLQHQVLFLKETQVPSSPTTHGSSGPLKSYQLSFTITVEDEIEGVTLS